MSTKGLDVHDTELAGRLRRLDALEQQSAPVFDYAGLMARQAASRQRAQRRQTVARGVACAVVLAMIGLSAWRLTPHDAAPVTATEAAPFKARVTAPRLIRADNFLVLAAIEDHIASLDDALTDARLEASRGADVARLERTRAELMDSYARVRYAQMVSNNF